MKMRTLQCFVRGNPSFADVSSSGVEPRGDDKETTDA